MERNKNVAEIGSFPGSEGGPNLLENHQNSIRKGKGKGKRKEKEKVVADKSDGELRIDPVRALTEDPDTNMQPPQRKLCKRRTKHQIEALEAVFKDFSHPDQKQILELSSELGLDSLHVKFWFQNKRTQIKKLMEQQENEQLRSENSDLKAENQLYENALTEGLCPTCGNPTMTAREKLMQENCFLKEEFHRLSTIVAQLVGGAMVFYGAPSQNAPPPN